MINTPPSPTSPSTDRQCPDSLDELSLESCEAIMICLHPGRFVIARPSEPQADLWPIGGGWDKVRQLQPGDQVVYKGTCATVKAVDVYR